MNTSSKPDDVDLAILLTAANRVLTDRLLDAMREAGLATRPRWGFVIRALHGEPLPLAEVAARLGVTKQAAQQTVDDMEAAGFVTREPDPADGRRKLLVLTAEGRRVRSTALDASARLEAELRSAVGDRAVDDLRRVLLTMVEQHGDLDDVLDGRSRALW